MNAAKGDTENANATLGYTKITSPIDGVITDRPNYPGETPATGTPVITVMDLSQIVARAHVAQLEAASLKVGDPATITIPGQATSVKGKVTLVSPAVDPNSTTVEVWVQAPNPKESLRPGTSVRVAMVAANGGPGRCDPPSGPADIAGWGQLSHRSGQRQRTQQEEGEGRHPGFRVQNRASHRRAARRGARGHCGSVRTCQRGRSRYWRKPKFRSRRQRCRTRTRTSNGHGQQHRDPDLMKRPPSARPLFFVFQSRLCDR